MNFRRILKYLVFSLGICFIIGYLFLVFSVFEDNVSTTSAKNYDDGDEDDNGGDRGGFREGKERCPIKDVSHKLCLVVPFRDRFDELLQFVPHMKKFLCRQGINNEIVVVNQGDDLRFNRGSLINIGYLISKYDLNCDYIAMHDVDLLPDNDQLNYSYPNNNPFHVAAPNLHPKYHYKNFVGGILLIKNGHYEEVNGLSNRFWGWGREDDEFFTRLKRAKLEIKRPVDIKTGNLTFKHMHDKYRRPRDYSRFGDQIAVSRKKDNVTGLNTISYTEISRHKFLIDDFPSLIVNIHLSCNVYETAWCMDYKQLMSYVKDMKVKMPADEYKEFIEVLKSHSIDVNAS